MTLPARAWAGFALRFVPLALLGAAAAQQAPPAPVASVAPVAPVNGRVEQHGGLKVLHVWGTPAERGYAHGRLLAADIANAALMEFGARFARKQPLLQQARDAVGRLIEYPDDVKAELEGLWRGLSDAKVDLRMEELDRAFDFQDLLIANALDVFGLMGCSGFTVWGDRAAGGGVLTARNFDWPLTGAHMLDHTIVLVQHLPGGRATAAVTWPGYVGAVTGVSSDGVAAFLHVGSAKVTFTPEPSSWPSAIAARSILERGAAGDVFAGAKDLLGYTSPPAGFLTHVVLPAVPGDGPPAAVFETDAGSSARAALAGNPIVVTNHFRTRQDGRPSSKDSREREQRLGEGVAGCLQVGDKVVSVDEAWQALASVQRGGNDAFGTLHSLVFRHEPWCFELRVAEMADSRVVAAPSSARRHVLTKKELFGEATAK